MTRTMMGSMLVLCCGLAMMPALVQPHAPSVSDSQGATRPIVANRNVSRQALLAQLQLDTPPTSPPAVLLAEAR